MLDSFYLPGDGGLAFQQVQLYTRLEIKGINILVGWGSVTVSWRCVGKPRPVRFLLHMILQ